MSLLQILDVAESLLQLDPVRSYPPRGAEQVAKIVRATGYQLVLGELVRYSDPRPPSDLAPTLVLALRNGREPLGELSLFVDGSIAYPRMKFVWLDGELVCSRAASSMRTDFPGKGDDVEENPSQMCSNARHSPHGSAMSFHFW